MLELRRASYTCCNCVEISTHSRNSETYFNLEVLDVNRFALVAIAIVGLGVVVDGNYAYGFSDAECREVLNEHPGSFPAHPAGHPRQNETVNEEVDRTDDQQEHHRKLTYFHSKQIVSCLQSMSRNLEYQERRLMEILQTIETKINLLGRDIDTLKQR